jgi:predicted enzyme related to lactoylglutathione lyase
VDDCTGLSEQVVIPADNLQRAAGFYARVFQCEVEAAADDTYRFSLPPIGEWAGVQGVIRLRSPNDADATNAFTVSSLEGATDRLVRFGGRLLAGPLLAGRVRLSLCQDTEGNRFSLEALRIT